MTTKYIQLPTCKLAEFVAAATTSFDVSGFLYNDGVTAVDPADIGDVCYATLEPRTAREELISFKIDSVTAAGVATITAVRGLSQKSPYSTGGAAFDHQNGSDFVISNNPGLFNRLTAKDNAEEVTAQWVFPTPTTAGAPVTKSYAEAQFVYKTGAQSIAGVKTFTNKPVVPVATEAGNPIRKDTFDAQTVKLTGVQTIAGVKTFSASPIVPTATTANQAMNKSQVESYVAANSGDVKASDSAFGTVKLDVAADVTAEPIAIGVNSPINESKRSVDPTDDAGRLVQLESNGKLSNEFIFEGFFGNTREHFDAGPHAIAVDSDGLFAKSSALDFAKFHGFTLKPNTVPGLTVLASGSQGSSGNPSFTVPAGENRAIFVFSRKIGFTSLDGVSWNSITGTLITQATNVDRAFAYVIPVGDSVTDETYNIILSTSGTTTGDEYLFFAVNGVDQSTPTVSQAVNPGNTISQTKTFQKLVLFVSANSYTSAANDSRMTLVVARSECGVAIAESGGISDKTFSFSASSSLSTIGFCINPAEENTEEMEILNSTVVGGFTGLTPGADYYLSDTRGQISTTPGTTSVKIGVAVSETQLFIKNL